MTAGDDARTAGGSDDTGSPSWRFRLASLARAPRPRIVDWTLFGLVALLVGTGLLGLVTGAPGDWFVIAIHGVAGIAIVAPLVWKLRRVRGRVATPTSWDAYAVAAVLVAALAIVALVTGLLWAFGVEFGVWRWTGLMVHMVVGALTIPPLLVHLAGRFRPPKRTDADRRTALQYAAVAAGGVVAWRAQRALAGLLGAADRRFTGSRRAGGEGNDFPVTSWVADDPAPVDVEEWTLAVDGAVATERSLGYDDVEPASTEGAILDCTSGWYADREWAGVRVGTLLDQVTPEDDAAYVSFHSVTGYRWSLPIEEARAALLATSVGGERLTHSHGAPLRLVAPDRRGFQWVKWIERVEVRTTPDYGQWIAIFVSGFD